MHIDHNFRGGPLQNFKVMDRDLTRLQLDLLPFTRHFVGLASLYFHSRIGRRRLLDFTVTPRESR